MIQLEISVAAVIATIIPIIGWYIVHRLSVNRDRANKRRDLRVTYLIEAYRRIERSANRPKTYDNNLELESAIADIQLFGSPRQVELAVKFAFDIAKKSNASTDELLTDLRKELRGELDLEPVAPEITYLRLHDN